MEQEIIETFAGLGYLFIMGQLVTLTVVGILAYSLGKLIQASKDD